MGKVTGLIMPSDGDILTGPVEEQQIMRYSFSIEESWLKVNREGKEKQGQVVRGLTCQPK